MLDSEYRARIRSIINSIAGPNRICALNDSGTNVVKMCDIHNYCEVPKPSYAQNYSKFKQSQLALELAVNYNKNIFILDFGVSGASSNLMFKTICDYISHRFHVDSLRSTIETTTFNYILIVPGHSNNYFKFKYICSEQNRIIVKDSKCVLALQKIYSVKKTCRICKTKYCEYRERLKKCLKFDIHVITDQHAYQFESGKCKLEYC